MLKRSLRALWIYITIICFALCFLIAGIVLMALQNEEVPKFQSYISTNCTIVGYSVNMSHSDSLWFVKCIFNLKPEYECCVRGFYLSPPKHSSGYSTEESADAEAPSLCPYRARYICWYDPYNLNDNILLLPPSISTYEVAIIICFSFMSVFIAFGVLLRLGCIPCGPWLTQEKKQPESVSEKQGKSSSKRKKNSKNKEKGHNNFGV